jgi:hypothetical protein
LYLASNHENKLPDLRRCFWAGRGAGAGDFIVFQGIIKGTGLQALVQIVYQILDETRNVVL